MLALGFSVYQRCEGGCHCARRTPRKPPPPSCNICAAPRGAPFTEVQGVGFRVQGAGLRVQSVGFAVRGRVWGQGFWNLGCRVNGDSDLGFGVWGAGFKVWALEFGAGFWVLALGVRVLGLGFWL